MGQRLGAVLPIVVIGIIADLAVDILLDVEIVLALRGAGPGVGHRISRKSQFQLVYHKKELSMQKK